MAKRVDENQAEIVNGLRQAGCSVLSLAEIGHGAPDILLWHPRTNRLLLMEIKNGKQPLSKRQLTRYERAFHEKWRGPIHIVESLEAALNAIFSG